ncbi:hypothetical protein PN480_06370 [Dolichospermum circinale CS-1225]|uniref:DUF6932 family protein n=1 Tax=Dolichospermum circinale TaxID=109265 RepID=UPI0004221ABA|nr:hypothetical protein [Dolichospermum circinale]MDB9458853.1 hypothetical protein [Dolichospermum circinale CS-545/17]MDB9468820.1 hypothetical protein [Dolichospermum circinale CS-539/09]MDB9471185.1 hypothetical protein [Dolichospermum circinale CS-539]MDB9521578.1 hypothetical protein [Dolichospermum circinale CS-1225]
MIFTFNQNGNLLPGIHLTNWEEIEEYLAYNKRRKNLLSGLKQGCEILKQCGCHRIYIGGSFVTTKRLPNDFDVCWEDDEVDFKLLKELDPVLHPSSRRSAQKNKYGWEFSIANNTFEDPFTTCLEFFQQDRNGNIKGIVVVDL